MKTPAWFDRQFDVRFADVAMESREFIAGNADAMVGNGFQGHRYQHDLTKWTNYTAGYDMGLDGECVADDQ